LLHGFGLHPFGTGWNARCLEGAASGGLTKVERRIMSGRGLDPGQIQSTNRFSGDIPMRNMTLDLNDLAVETFTTVEGDPSQWLMRAPRATEDRLLCAAEETFACLAGSPTNDVILC
jgi:hypothetical protein